MTAMKNYTERGLADTLRGFAEAHAVLKRRALDLTAKLQALEIEITQINKIAGALGLAIEIIEAEAAMRPKADDAA